MTFRALWNTNIKPLEGHKINTATGKENLILEVTDTHLKRRSSNGRISAIRFDVFETVYNELLKRGHITRNEVLSLINKRASSIVVVVLAELDIIELYTSPTIGIKLRS